MGRNNKIKKELRAIGLTQPEIKFWRALETGDSCRFDPNVIKKKRTLRGEILGSMLRGDKIQTITPPTLPRQIVIFGAIIVGRVDLSDTDIFQHTLSMKKCHFQGVVQFSRASFAQLNFQDSHFERGARFKDINVKSHVFISNIHSLGRLAFNGALVGGQFFANEAEVSNPKGKTIDAQGAQIKGGVFLRGAKLKGCTAFNRVRVGGQFSASDAEFSNVRGKAIHAQGAQIKDGVFLQKATLIGYVAFNRARIGGQFLANGANFSNPGQTAINAQNANIEADVFLKYATIIGCVDFNGARISGQFVAQGLSLINVKGAALVLQGASVSESTWLNGFLHPPIGNVDLARSDIGDVKIDRNSYPLGVLNLDGTRYRSIEESIEKKWLVPKVFGWMKKPKSSNFDDGRHVGFWSAYAPLRHYLETVAEVNSLCSSELSQRVFAELKSSDGLDLKTERSPFAYREFARVLDVNGHEREARDVRIAAGHAYTDRIAETFAPWRAKLYRFWRFCLRHMIGYGIKPWRIFYVIAIWWALGVGVFSVYSNDMTPARERFYLTQTDELGQFKTLSPNDPLPNGYPHFNATIYALDVMLPVVDFAQETHWRPKNAVPRRVNWLRNFNRLFLALGWMFSTIAVLGFTGLISDKRED